MDTTDTQPMIRTAIFLRPDQRETLTRLAGEKDCSMADIVRNAIDIFLAYIPRETKNNPSSDEARHAA